MDARKFTDDGASSAISPRGQVHCVSISYTKKMPAFKVGNQWRFKKGMIEDWLNKNINTDYPKTTPK